VQSVLGVDKDRTEESIGRLKKKQSKLGEYEKGNGAMH